MAFDFKPKADANAVVKKSNEAAGGAGQPATQGAANPGAAIAVVATPAGPVAQPAASPVAGAQPQAQPERTAQSGESRLVAVSAPSRSLQVVDLDANPLALLDLNDAQAHLGQSLPFRRIEYCANSAEAAELGLQKGLITDTLTMKQKQVVPAILIAQKFSRAYLPPFEPGREMQAEPVCLSSNGRCMTGGSAMKEGESQVLCSDCSYAQWVGEEKPACAEVYSLLCFDVEDEMPFVFNVRRTGVKPWRKAQQVLVVYSIKFQHQGVKAPNLCVQFGLSTRAKATYFLPVFDDFKAAAKETSEGLYHALGGWLSVFSRTDYAATAQEPEEGTAG